MKTPGTPLNWYVSYPARGIAKPGLVVHSGTLQCGLGIMPCIGHVRGIFSDEHGEFWVQVAFVIDGGYVGTHHVSAVSGHYPQEWNQYGDWNAVPGYIAQQQRARVRAGLPPRVPTFRVPGLPEAAYV